MTKKARFIKKMTTLSNKEKAEIISFFSKYPNYESRIDWNRKNLKYSDFEKVFALAKISVKNKKRKAKENPRLLFENYNCEILFQNEDFLIAVPLDWECAVFFNSFDCGGEGAKWCIGDSGNPSTWNSYAKNKNIFALVYFIKKQPVFGRKIIFQYDFECDAYQLWFQNNKGIKSYKSMNFLFNYIDFLSKSWTWVIMGWVWAVFRKNIRVIAQAFRVIRKDLPAVGAVLWQKIDIPLDAPLKFEIGLGLTQLISADEKADKFIKQIKDMRYEISKEYGVKIPPIRILDNTMLAYGEYQFFINENFTGRGLIPLEYIDGFEIVDNSDAFIITKIKRLFRKYGGKG